MTSINTNSSSNNNNDDDTTTPMVGVFHVDWTCPVCRLDLQDNRDTMVPVMLLGCRTMAHGICAQCALALRRKDVAFKCPTCRAEALMIIPIRPLVKTSVANTATLTLLGGDAATATVWLSPPGRFVHSWVQVVFRALHIMQTIAITLIVMATAVTLVENLSIAVFAFCGGLVSASERVAGISISIFVHAVRYVIEPVACISWRALECVWGADSLLKFYNSLSVW